jgi:hypothetical protein
MFDAVKRDGTLDWRLRVEDQWIGVNCLSYTRWAEVWPRARRLFVEAIETLGIDGNVLSNAALQCFDVFDWTGDVGGYDLSLLLRRDSPYVPAALWEQRSPLWHLHEGWYERRPDLIADQGQLLNRIHFDATTTAQRYSVTVDHLLRADMPAGPTGLDELFGGEPSFIDRMMNALHIRNKEMLGLCITDDLAHRIGLNATRDESNRA